MRADASTRRLRGSALVTACGGVLAACSGGPDAAVTSAARDSAGVRIVESHAPRWNESDVWRLAAEPSVEIGREQDLYQVRGAFRGRDGRIIVVEASTLSLLVHDAEGRFVARIGGSGGGPGEFRDMSRVRRGAGDSIVIFDFSNARITVVDGDGRIARTQPGVPTLPGGAAAFVEDVFGDGALLVTPIGGPPSGDGLTRRQRALWRIDPGGGDGTLLAEFPELEMFFFRTMPRPIAWRQPFFGRNAYYTAGDQRLYWGSTERYDLHVLAPDGAVEAIFRRVTQPRTYGARDLASLIEEAVAASSNEAARPALRAVLEELPTSGTVPAWGWSDFAPPYGPALQIDAAGNLWVAEYPMPGNATNRRAVFDADGVWLGVVDLPPRFAPYDIGSAWILGVWRDELDVEFVRLYRIIKPTTSS